MPQVQPYIKVPVVDGVNFVINPIDNTMYYYIYGTATLTTNWAISAGSGITEGMRCYFQYKANTTIGSNHMYILGAQIPDNITTKNFDAMAFYESGAWTVRFDPDFEEIDIVATNDIMDDAVTNDKLNNMTRGTIKVGGVSDAPIDLNAKTSGYILVGDGTDINSVALSSDATISSTGALTISANAVTNSKLAAMTRGTVKVGGVGNAATDLNAKTSGNILIGDGTDLVSVPMTGDVSISSAGVTTVLANGPWEVGIGTASAQMRNTTTGCSATGDYSIAGGQNCLSSDDTTIALGNSCSAISARAIAMGNNAISNQNDSIAIGKNVTASGVNAVTIGNTNTSSGQGSLSLGAGNTSSGLGSVTIGSYCKASGIISAAKGYIAVSNINYSEAFASGCFNALSGNAQEIHTILKIETVNNTPDNLRNEDSTDGITIPTDCTANVQIRLVAVQTGGSSGTIGDSFMQNIKFCCKNIAGISSVVTMNAATLTNYSTVTGNVLYELSACDAAFAGTVSASVVANKIQIAVTGESNKNIQWIAYVSMVWTGYRNFSI